LTDQLFRHALVIGGSGAETERMDVAVRARSAATAWR
jgi:hypothetical protein